MHVVPHGKQIERLECVFYAVQPEAHGIAGCGMGFSSALVRRSRVLASIGSSESVFAIGRSRITHKRRLSFT